MGLVVKVYSNLTPLDGDQDTDVLLRTGRWVNVHNYPEFSSRCNLFPKGEYEGDLIMDCVWAQSCRNFNNFRRGIARVVGINFDDMNKDTWLNYKDVDFFELLWFADNEGTIDYVIAEKLHNDFVNNLFRAEENTTFWKVWGDAYLNWIEGLRICFHNKGLMSFG